MKTTRKRYSAEFKAKVAMEVIRGDLTLAELAAKHGVLGLTKTVALELATFGITCNAICPGYVHTPLVDAQIADTAKARGLTPDQVMKDVILAAQPTKKFVQYDEIAGMLLYLASDEGGSANGQAFTIDGGWTAA